jgi:signal transduction histidine kinase/CheY-like chemotaxis protein
MSDDWRFSKSPHVVEGGLRAYAGVPLQFQTEFDEHVAFGSLCVASNSPQENLTPDQQRSLARLADWIVADIITSCKARRQRERQQLNDMAAQLQKQCKDGADMEDEILRTLRMIYPNAIAGIYPTTTGHIQLEDEVDFDTSELDRGLWEDSQFLDRLVEDFNHRDLIAPRVVRIIGTQCASQETPTFLLVSSKDFRYIFDDVDSGFVDTCATILCRYWQGRALTEALKAKEMFLRGITHQLRTPIHGILGTVELLTEELKSRNLILDTAASSPNTTPDVEHLDPYLYIKTIKTSARELISTVNSLIKLNQWANIAEAGRKPSLQNVAHVESLLLDGLLLLPSHEAPTRPSIIFQRNFPKNCDSLTIDLRLFLQCVQPLLVNAIQNTPGGVVAVTISVTEGFQSLTVDIEDDGRGIHLKDQKRIFTAYEKVDAHTVGAGLGLSLSCQSAALQNGEVSLVWSELGKGSHFRAVFLNPVCSSSLPKKPAIEQQLIHLPRSYHYLSPSYKTSLLGQQVGQYLKRRTFTESTTSAGSLLLQDFTSDMKQLSDNIRSVAAGQVAICLVPENTCSVINFGTERFYTENNVLFVQGPFMSDLLEESLVRADAILAGFAATTLNSGSCAFGGVAVENSKTTPSERCGNANPLALTLETELSQSVQALKLGTGVLPEELQISVSSKRPMFLLVDDNAINLRLLEMYCTRRNIPYRTAKDGAEAVRVFKNHRMPVDDPLLRQPLVTQPFDLIFMDLQMPICDGIDATRQVRAMEEEYGWNRSVIYIVTGQDSPSDRSNVDEAGADGYLVKPVGPKDLDRWVKQCFPNFSR